MVCSQASPDTSATFTKHTNVHLHYTDSQLWCFKDLTVKNSHCLSFKHLSFFSIEKEVKESEEKKSTARPFLRHRFLSKEEDVQKVPG